MNKIFRLTRKNKQSSDLEITKGMLSNIEKQNEKIIQQNQSSLKKLDRIIGHKVVFIEDGVTFIRLIDGSRLYVNPKDQDIGQYVAIHGFWEPHIENVWRKLVKNEDVIFDIGANFGYFSAIAARKMRSGQIHLFEANDKFENYLQMTMASNGFLNRSSIEICGISNKTGTINLNESQNFWGRSTMTNHSMGEEGVLKKVKTITLDEYCDKKKIDKVDLIKIDIEGFEEKAYEGMSRIVNRSSNLKMVLEFSAGHYNKPEAFFSQLKRDFEYIYVFNSNGSISKCTAYPEIAKAKVGSNTMLLLSKVEVAI